MKFCVYIPLLLSLQPSPEGRSIQEAPCLRGYQAGREVLVAPGVPVQKKKKNMYQHTIHQKGVKIVCVCFFLLVVHEVLFLLESLVFPLISIVIIKN